MEFQSIVENCETDLYLVNALEMLKLIPRDNNMLYHLRKSPHNMLVRPYNVMKNEDVIKNLFLVFCAILNIQLKQRDAPDSIEDKTIQQNLRSIDLERDSKVAYHGELAAIKELICRRHFSISERQVQLIHDSFRNLHDNRLNFIGSNFS